MDSHGSVLLLAAILRWAGWLWLVPFLVLMAFGVYVQLFEEAEAPVFVSNEPRP